MEEIRAHNCMATKMREGLKMKKIEAFRGKQRLKFILPPIVGLLMSQYLFAAPLEIVDSRGIVSFDKTPQKIAVVNWTLTEQLLMLDVALAGVADANGYRASLGHPPLSELVVDLGPRLQPNLNALRELAPDVILIGYDQKNLVRPLQNIAPVIYFKNFGRRYNNEEKSREIYLKLAAFFDKTELATQRLTALDQKIEQLKIQANTLFLGNKPNIAIVVPDDNDKTQYWAFVDNSLPDYALKSLDFTNAFSDQPTKFGFKRVKLVDSDPKRTCYLVVSKPERQTELANTAPFSCATFIEDISFYGGALSKGVIAQGIVDALSSLSESKTK